MWNNGGLADIESAAEVVANTEFDNIPHVSETVSNIGDAMASIKVHSTASETSSGEDTGDLRGGYLEIVDHIRVGGGEGLSVADDGDRESS